jgi:hypothetical protein
VLRLKTVGTVEERVVGVAMGKAQLADRSITGGCRQAKEKQSALCRAVLSVPHGSPSAVVSCNLACMP